MGCWLFIYDNTIFRIRDSTGKVEEADFPIKDQKKAILGSVITCGAIYTIFYFCLAGAMPWAELTNGGDCHPFITFEALQYCFGDKIAWFVLIMGYCRSCIPNWYISTWFLVFRCPYDIRYGSSEFPSKAVLIH